jgi:hypothetical protein
MDSVVPTSSSARQEGRIETRIRAMGRFVKRFLYDHRFLTCAAISLTIGFAIGLFFKMLGRGIINGGAPFITVLCAIIWLTIIVVIDFAWPRKNRTFGDGFFVGIGRGIINLVIISVAGLLAVEVFPDPARIYLRVRYQYIQSHWMTDPVSGLSYFPLDYTRVNELETFPRNFYLLDENGTFEVDRYSDRLLSPACPQAKYSAEFLGNKIYIVRFYVIDSAEQASPCLVTPIPRKGNQP